MDVTQADTLRHFYRPLRDTSDEIRLLQLHSKQRNALGDDTIGCSLARTSLSDVGSFEALSYTWGDARNRKTIQVNGRQFQVTHNLYVALQHLRRDNEVRCLWIDAICINQDDLGERSSQVAQMEHIYRLATTVIVFLGQTWPGRDAAMDLIVAMAEDNALHLDPSLEPHVASHGMIASTQKLQSHMVEFYSLPWWSRVWTVQEYCLASDAIFQCGDRIVTNRVLRDWSENVHKHTTSCCSGFYNVRSREDDPSFNTRVGGQIRRLCTLQYYQARRRGTPLLEVLMTFRARECEDPRDKIYGLPGLVYSEERSTIQPNYARSPKDVYFDILLASIRFMGSLNILSCKTASPTSGLNLPNFVPDWTIDLTEDAIMALLNRLCDAHAIYDVSKCSIADVHNVADGIMLLGGVQVDQIHQILSFD